jgi:DNA-binding transcriptional regulator YiaG
MTHEHLPACTIFEFDHRLARGAAVPHARMTPEQFCTMIKSLGLTLSSAAAVFGVHPRTTRRWANGEREIPGPVRQFLRHLVMQKAASHHVSKPRAKKIKTNGAPKLNAIGKPYGENYDPNYRVRYLTRRVSRHQTNIGPGISPERWEVMCRQAQAAWDAKMAVPD